MIKNLPRQLNEAGKIKIGKKGNMITSAKGKEFRPPKKLDHFQLVTTEKNTDGDYIVDIDLQNKIKDSKNGIVNKDGCLVGLPIRLLYNDTELNFPHRYVSYVSGKMSCHGDGEKARKRVDNFKAEHTCPCDRVVSGYQGQDKCKPTGTLTCVIDEAGLFGQAHKFRTTSMNTIKGILGGIELIKTATNGKIAGLPLMLTMNAKQTTTPQGIATTVYIVSICYRGSMSDLRTEVLQLMSTEKQYLLSMDSIEDKVRQEVEIVDAEEEREFVEEFFPDAVTVEATVVEAAKEVKSTEPEPEAMVESKPESEPSEFKQVKENETYKNILEPGGTYAKIYESFTAETDIDKAMTFANRLMKGNLLYWLVNTYPDIDFEQNIKKPEALELVRSVLESVLPEAAEVVEEVPEEVQEVEEVEEVEEIQEATEEKSDPAPQYPQEWDESGKIQKDQLRELVRLKGILEKQGTLQPDKWELQVNYFLDAEKNPISKAINMTKDQGENLIMILESNVKEEIAA